MKFSRRRLFTLIFFLHYLFCLPRQKQPVKLYKQDAEELLKSVGLTMPHEATPDTDMSKVVPDAGVMALSAAMALLGGAEAGVGGEVIVFRRKERDDCGVMLLLLLFLLNLVSQMEVVTVNISTYFLFPRMCLHVVLKFCCGGVREHLACALFSMISAPMTSEPRFLSIFLYRHCSHTLAEMTKGGISVAPSCLPASPLHAPFPSLYESSKRVIDQYATVTADCACGQCHARTRINPGFASHCLFLFRNIRSRTPEKDKEEETHAWKMTWKYRFKLKKIATQGRLTPSRRPCRLKLGGSDRTPRFEFRWNAQMIAELHSAWSVSRSTTSSQCSLRRLY